MDGLEIEESKEPAKEAVKEDSDVPQLIQTQENTHEYKPMKKGTSFVTI